MATTAGIKAGRAFIIIEAVDATGKIMQSIGNRLKSWGRSLMMTGLNVGFQSFLAGTAMAGTINRFLKFDDAMRRVEARSEGTAAELNKLRDAAMHLSTQSALSSTDLANLMAELAQMGFKRGEIAEMLNPINLLAQAGGTGNKTLDAVNAAKLVAGTLRAMNMEFSEAQHVADVYAQALNLSNAALEDMAVSMAYAAPAAYRYKVSLEDTASVIGYLRNLNIDAETAGTGFRNMLLEMSESKGREKFGKMLEDLTGKTISFIDAAGNLRKPTDLLFAIGEAMKGLGTAQQGELLFTLFGKRAIIPASALAEGQNAFAGIRIQMDDVNGVAEQMKNIMEGGLGGAWRRFLHFLDNVAIKLGEALSPALMRASKQFASLAMAAIEWVTRNRGLIATIAALIPLWGAFAITLIVVGLNLRLLAMLIVPVATGLRLLALTGGILNRVFDLTLSGLRVLLITLPRLAISLGVVAARMLYTATIAGAKFLILMGVDLPFALKKLLLEVTHFTGAMVYALSSLGQSIIFTLQTGFSLSLMTLSQSFRWAFQAAGGFFAMSQMLVGVLGVLGSIAPVAVVLALGAALAYVGYLAASGMFSKISAGLATVRDASVMMFDDIKAGFSEWLGEMKTSAIEIGELLKSSFGGIVQAMELGDMQAAWEIALSGLYASWLKLADALMSTWEKVLRFAQEGWLGLRDMTLDAYDQAMTYGVETFDQGAVYDEQGRKIQEARKMTRDEYLEDKKQKRMQAREKELAGLRRKHDIDRSERDFTAIEARRQLEEKLEDIRMKQVAEHDRRILNMGGLEPLGAGGPPPIPSDILGIGAGAAGMMPEIKEGLIKGTVEAAKAAYESQLSAQESERLKELKVQEDIKKAVDEAKLAIVKGIIDLSTSLAGV